MQQNAKHCLDSFTLDELDEALDKMGYEIEATKGPRVWVFYYWYKDPTQCTWANSFKKMTDFIDYGTKKEALFMGYRFIISAGDRK